MKKTACLLLLLNYALVSAWAQTNPESISQGNTLTFSPLDTLQSKRSLLSTAIYQGDVKLRPKSVIALYREDPGTKRRYQLGRALLPVGPLVSLAGIGVTAIALKGTPATREVKIDGKPTTVQFTKRSQVKFVAGVGLFLGGIALVEVANELIGNSAIRFNNRLKNKQAATLHLGITPGGGMGMYVRF